jgi:hypothetical protein
MPAKAAASSARAGLDSTHDAAASRLAVQPYCLHPLRFKVKDSPIGHHHDHDHAGGAKQQQQQQQQQQQHRHQHQRHHKGGRKDLYKAWKHINGLGEDFKWVAGRAQGTRRCIMHMALHG